MPDTSTQLDPEIEAERERLNQIAEEAFEQSLIATRAKEKAFKELVEFEYKHEVVDE